MQGQIKAVTRFVLVLVICQFFCSLASAEILLMEGKNFVFNISPYFRTDVVTLKNNLYLDNKNKDDSSTYLGIDYSLGFDLKAKDGGPEAFLRLERNGPYDYDAPIFIHNTLQTQTAPVERYRNAELLPHVEEFWYDFGLFELPARLKSGLFLFGAGNNISVPADYENYSMLLYNKSENFKWEFYYCRPGLVNKSFLGPYIKQEREQGIHYTPNKANFVAADALFKFKNNTFQPYVEVLSDYSGKRTSLFSASTHDDILGTFGLAWNFTLDKLSIALETAKNFGRAKSSNDDYKDVEHCGYIFYGEAYYDLTKLTPHSRFVYSSGNKVDPDMAGDSTFTSGKNRAFSNYSPFNTNLAASIYPDAAYLPLVAMGAGNGINYGISRPDTFGDPQLFDNLILLNLGLDYALTEKFTVTFDWWYLRSTERGVGTFEV